MSKVPTVTAESFERDVLASPVPVVLDFNATWCGPCRALAPIVEKLAERQAGKARVLAIDADECAEIAARYKVRSLPTVITFVGGKEHKRHTGTANLEVLTSLLPSAVA